VPILIWIATLACMLEIMGAPSMAPRSDGDQTDKD
jgi:hypothetical protein